MTQHWRFGVHDIPHHKFVPSGCVVHMYIGITERMHCSSRFVTLPSHPRSGKRSSFSACSTPPRRYSEYPCALVLAPIRPSCLCSSIRYVSSVPLHAPFQCLRELEVGGVSIQTVHESYKSSIALRSHMSNSQARLGNSAVDLRS